MVNVGDPDHGKSTFNGLEAARARMSLNLQALRAENDEASNQGAREGNYTPPQKTNYNQR